MKGEFSMKRFNMKDLTTNAKIISAMDEQYELLQNADTTSKRKTYYKHMCELYERFPLLHDLWIHVENAYHYVKAFIRRIIITVNQIVNDLSHDYFYIMRFYRKDGSFLFDKVGSAQHPRHRRSQHLNYYDEAYDADILLCVDTGSITASSLEDKVRSYFIRKYGEENFISKDRFKCKVDIDDIKAKIPTCLQKLREAEIV